MLGGLMVLNSVPALAACHHFSVTAIPPSVAEGAKVLVTVSRDGNAAPSSIDLSTVDETAKAGTDYVAIHQTVAFTSEVQKQFTLSTIDDHLTESSQTFRLHLSNPAGCFGSGYVVDPDVRVTITDHDATPTPKKSPTATATATATAKPKVAPASPTPTPSAKPSPRTSKTVKPSAPATTSPSQSPSRVVAAGSSSSSGIGGALAWAAVALVVVIAGGTFVLRRRRTIP
jgi:hypothetical protein